MGFESYPVGSVAAMIGGGEAEIGGQKSVGDAATPRKVG